MTQEQIEEGNKAIAIFDGWEAGRYSNLKNKLHKGAGGKEVGISIDQLQYHSSWDWLMPVVEKINKLAIDNIGEIEVVIYSNLCTIGEERETPFIQKVSDISLIEAVWLAVIEFIKYYNSQQNTLKGE